MASTIAEMDMIKTMSNVTMTMRLRRVREARLRMWLGLQLLQLVAWILPQTVDIEIRD